MCLVTSSISIEEEIRLCALQLKSYTKIIKKILEICNDIDIVQLASPSINFRDAMFHYMSMWENRELENIIGQRASIEEHLSRGFKDSIIYILSVHSDRISKMLINSNISDQIKNKLREYSHFFKNFILDIRIGNQSIQRNSDDLNLKELFDNLNSFSCYLKDINMFQFFVSQRSSFDNFDI